MYEKFKEFGLNGYPPEIRGRFNSFITTQFDDSLSVEMQIRSIIKWAVNNFDETVNQTNHLIDFINDLIEYMNEFIETFDVKYQETILEKMQEWYDNGELETLINESLDTKYHEMDNRLTQTTADLLSRGVNVLNPPAPHQPAKVGDDITDLLNDLFQNENTTVVIPTGRFIISDSVHISMNSKLVGVEGSEILITGNTDGFKLNYRSSVSGLDVVIEDQYYNSNVFEISTQTLDLGGFVDVKLKQLNVYFPEFVHNGYREGTVFLMYASREDEEGVIHDLNQDILSTGFAHVDFEDINIIGSVKYAFRSYEYKVTPDDFTWITGCNFTNITVNGAKYGYFGSKSEDTMENLDYSDGGMITFDKFQMQFKQSANMFFFVEYAKTIKNSVAWDWFQASEPLNKPILALYSEQQMNAPKVSIDFEWNNLEARCGILNVPNHLNYQKTLEEVFMDFQDRRVKTPNLFESYEYKVLPVLSSGEYPKYTVLATIPMKLADTLNYIRSGEITLNMLGSNGIHTNYGKVDLLVLLSGTYDSMEANIKTQNLNVTGASPNDFLNQHYGEFYLRKRQDDTHKYIDVVFKQTKSFGYGSYIVANSLWGYIAPTRHFNFHFVDLESVDESQLEKIEINAIPRKVGTTEQRPTFPLYTGLEYYDTTLNKPVYYTGGNWRDASGALM